MKHQVPFPALYDIAKAKQHRKPRKTATNTIVCLIFCNHFSGRNVWPMVITKVVQQDLMLQLPKTIPCSLSLFSPPNCCLSLSSALDFSLPVPVITWIYLLPSISFFPPPPPFLVKWSFFLLPRKFIFPCYLITLCNSMPNTLSFFHWLCVPRKTKWLVLALTYCTLPGMKNATVLVLRKIPLISGLCAHTAGKPTFLRERHLTPTSLQPS